jgi:hypothetical protein
MNCKAFIRSLVAASLLSLTVFPGVAKAEWLTVYRDAGQQVDVETKYSNGYGLVPYMARIVNAYPQNGVAIVVVRGTMMCEGQMYQPHEVLAFGASGQLISRIAADGRWHPAFDGTIDDRIHDSLCRSPFDEP